MEIVEVPIQKLKRDPTQPRQWKDPEYISDLAKSIVTEGIINPIEIDENYVIVTGEMRWTAAQEAGLKTVPCKIIDVDADRRFLRQVIENIHHNTMSPIDTGKALKRLLKNAPMNGPSDKGYAWLGKLIGRRNDYIAEYVSLLDESRELQKAINKGTVQVRSALILRRLPGGIREEVEERVIAGEFFSLDVLMILAKALKEHPEMSKEILRKKYHNVSTAQTTEILIGISPIFTPLHRQIELGQKLPDKINSMAMELSRILEESHASGVGSIHLRDTVTSLRILEERILQWIKPETKAIGMKVIN